MSFIVPADCLIPFSATYASYLYELRKKVWWIALTNFLTNFVTFCPYELSYEKFGEYGPRELVEDYKQLVLKCRRLHKSFSLHSWQWIVEMELKRELSSALAWLGACTKSSRMRCAPGAAANHEVWSAWTPMGSTLTVANLENDLFTGESVTAPRAPWRTDNHTTARITTASPFATMWYKLTFVGTHTMARCVVAAV